MYWLGPASNCVPIHSCRRATLPHLLSYFPPSEVIIWHHILHSFRPSTATNVQVPMKSHLRLGSHLCIICHKNDSSANKTDNFNKIRKCFKRSVLLKLTQEHIEVWKDSLKYKLKIFMSREPQQRMTSTVNFMKYFKWHDVNVSQTRKMEEMGVWYA